MSLERDKLWIKRIEVNTLAGRGCDAARSTTKNYSSPLGKINKTPLYIIYL